jgi:hypothetical protein
MLPRGEPFEGFFYIDFYEVPLAKAEGRNIVCERHGPNENDSCTAHVCARRSSGAAVAC